MFKGWVDEASFAPASPGTGMPIAIKKLNQESFQSQKEWLVSVAQYQSFVNSVPMNSNLFMNLFLNLMYRLKLIT